MTRPMPLFLVSFVGLASLGLAAVATAQNNAAPPPPQGQHAMPPHGGPHDMPAEHARHMAMAHAPVVAARQAGFHLTLAAFLELKAGIARGDDVTTLALPAAAIASWGSAIPTMFPPGTDTAASTALPSVWRDRPGFEAAAAAMTRNARALADLGKAGDKAGFAAQFALLGKSCNDCHTAYRKPDAK